MSMGVEEALVLASAFASWIAFIARFGGSVDELLSRLTRGVPAEIVVATDWLREVRVD